VLAAPALVTGRENMFGLVCVFFIIGVGCTPGGTAAVSGVYTGQGDASDRLVGVGAEVHQRRLVVQQAPGMKRSLLGNEPRLFEPAEQPPTKCTLTHELRPTMSSEGCGGGAHPESMGASQRRRVALAMVFEAKRPVVRMWGDPWRDEVAAGLGRGSVTAQARGSMIRTYMFF
jgi:hypothetical protein